MEHEHVHEVAEAGGLGDLLRSVFQGDWYMPHGHCYLWKPGLVGLHVASDVLIGTAYVLISIVLYALVRRIRLPFSTMIVAFGVFIGACGLTHFMEVWNVWSSAYWLAGWVKALTAFASVATGVYLFRARPTIVALANAARLSEERRVQLEQQNAELQILYARVREIDALKTEFFANVSHELRTPLALILGPVEQALAREQLSDTGRIDLQVVQRNARLLLRHVNALLDAAKLDAGRTTMSYAKADLTEIMRACTAGFDALVRDRGITLRLDGPPTLLVELDVEKMERVLLNLVGNGFKFTPLGGTLRCTWQEVGEDARFVIEDSGPGIPEAQREEVFERFHRGPDRGGGAGTGLGLAIAREFVRLHRGTIVLDDSPLGGARFTVTIPKRAAVGVVLDAAATELTALHEARELTQDMLAQQVTSTANGSGNATGPLVLAVDDTPDLLAFVERTLADTFRVETARDGVEALEKARAVHPDVIVSDIMMPRMGGDALLRELRADDRLATTPVLLLSARADDALRVELLDNGAQDYVVKPFLAAELRARVRNLVTMKRTNEVLQSALAVRSSDIEALARELASRQRQLEVALDAVTVARHQAIAESRAKSTLLRLVSHELRTPLSIVQLNLYRMGQRSGLSGEDREMVERVQRAHARLQSTVETIVEYTRIEAGQLVRRVARVDVGVIARGLVEELRPEAQRKLLTLDAIADSSYISTDERLVKLVLVNLLTNAIKYTQKGSIEVRVRAVGAAVEVEVADTGPGISEEQQGEIFSAFTQLESIERKSTPGLGLGLWLVREMVRALGGTINLRSAPGQGSTFAVTLPDLPATESVDLASE